MAGPDPAIQSQAKDWSFLPWMGGSRPPMENRYSGPERRPNTNARITPNTPVAAQPGNARKE
jgi:hypothetical protein